MSNKDQAPISEDVKALRDSLQGSVRSDEEVAEFMAKRKMVDVASDLNYELKDSGKFTLENFRGKDKESYLTSLRENRSICFMGESRAGKTHLASALCRESTKWGLRTKKINDYDFEREVKKEWNDFNFDSQARIESLKNSPVLFYDDFGKAEIFKDGKHTDYGKTLMSIFESRANKINVVTAGFYKHVDLFKHLGEELFGRVFHDKIDGVFYELKRGV